MNAPLKIAHLTPTFFSEKSVLGGGERYVFNIIDAVSRAAASDGSPIAQTVVSIGADAARFDYQGIPVRVLRNRSPVAGDMNQLSHLLREEIGEFDLIHIHQSLTFFGAYCMTVARSLGIPVVTTDLGGGNEETMLEWRGLELSDGVLSISKYAESLISSSFSGLRKVVIGPIDCDFFKPDPSVTRCRETVLCIGRILPHKGIDRIIRALPADFRLIVVGQQYHKPYYEHLVELAAGKHVDFISNANDEVILSLYRSAGLFIQASTHLDCYGNKVAKPELMGLTTLEAMSCGMPVIVSDAGSLPELVTSQQIGLVFSTHEDLVEIFKSYRRGDWPAADQPSLSRTVATQTYGYPGVGKAILEFYREILTGLPASQARPA